MEDKVKRTIFAILLITVSIIVASCETAGNAQVIDELVRTRDMERIAPENIIGRTLVSQTRNEKYQLLLHENGTFDYHKNDKYYSGMWEFSIDREILNYTFEWFEEHEIQAYIADLIHDNNEILWLGFPVAGDIDARLRVRFKFAN